MVQVLPICDDTLLGVGKTNQPTDRRLVCLVCLLVLLALLVAIFAHGGSTKLCIRENFSTFHAPRARGSRIQYMSQGI